ncbi:hypothetical protein AA18889_0311 [Acetobacter senegalensis DSM 18889]|nr:hypothetical protein AA18889_0311 [Acetobacter senegalensis DSM 18889]
MTDESRATFTLRASRELLDRLKQAADEHSHSMNAEIIQRLEWTLDDYRFQLHGPLGLEPADPSDAYDAINRVESELQQMKDDLQEFNKPNVKTDISPREKAGIAGWIKARITHLEKKRDFLKKNIVEERIKALIEQSNAEWERKYPDGQEPPTPYDIAVAEYDRIHGTKKKP